MPEIPIHELTDRQLLVHINNTLEERMSELHQHVENQLAQTEQERSGRLAAEEALRQAQETAAALTANDAEQEAQIVDLRSQIETAIDRLKSDDPQPEPEPEVQPEPEVEPDGTVTEPPDPGTDPAA